MWDGRLRFQAKHDSIPARHMKGSNFDCLFIFSLFGSCPVRWGWMKCCTMLQRWSTLAFSPSLCEIKLFDNWVFDRPTTEPFTQEMNSTFAIAVMTGSSLGQQTRQITAIYFFQPRHPTPQNHASSFVPQHSLPQQCKPTQKVMKFTSSTIGGLFHTEMTKACRLK